MIEYDTLLDLARQRLRDIASSPNFAREARETALVLGRQVQDELVAHNEGRPVRALVVTMHGHLKDMERVSGPANDTATLDTRCG